MKYVNAATEPVQVWECGLIVDIENGQLAASSDRIATVDGQDVVTEVKCLYSCRTLSPLNAIKLKHGEMSRLEAGMWDR